MDGLPTDRLQPSAMSRSSRLQAPLVLGFILLLAVAASSVWLFFVSDQINRRTAHSLQVRSAANQLLLLTQDAETGQRGFLLTRNKAYLDPYRPSTEAASQGITKLRDLVKGDAQESAIGEHLQTLVEAKLRELASTLVPAEKGDFDAALSIVNNDSGNDLMRDIRVEVGRINAGGGRIARPAHGASSDHQRVAGIRNHGRHRRCDGARGVRGQGPRVAPRTS